VALGATRQAVRALASALRFQVPEPQKLRAASFVPTALHLIFQLFRGMQKIDNQKSIRVYVNIIVS
jgi:hypothetical protein